MADTQTVAQPDVSSLFTTRRDGEGLPLCRGRVGDRLPIQNSCGGVPHPIPIHFNEMRVRITVHDSMFFPAKWPLTEQDETGMQADC